MNTMWKDEWKPLLWLTAIFLIIYYLPLGSPRFDSAVMEALALAKWYAREHVLLCLVPAFFIAGAIAVFVSQGSVMKYLGPAANRVIAYGVSSVSGTILAVCSCTVLPLFAGIYRMGAGLGPATAFLYSGPAINVLAIILTARILGLELGIARAVGAVIFSVVIGLVMNFIYRNEENEKAAAMVDIAAPEAARPLWKNSIFFALLVMILVFANWGKPVESSGAWHAVYSLKWIITAGASAMLAVILYAWFNLAWWKIGLAGIPAAVLSILYPETPLVPFTAGVIGISIITSTDRRETGDWFSESWGFAKQILPLLFFGVLVAGLLLGRPGHEGLIPAEWVSSAVGGNSVRSNLFASVAGAFMYFATLTEVPILQGLISSGMGKGPALALLLAGPALSLPNMLVIRSVMGTGKTVVYVLLVIVMSTAAGMTYGAIF